MKKEIKALKELEEDISNIKKDIKWAKDNGYTDLIEWMEACLETKENSRHLF